MSPPRRLTSEQARQMRIDAKGAAAPTYRELGEPYGLTAVAVYYIVSGKNYKEPEAQPDDPC